MTLARLIEAVEAGLATGGPADALAVPKEQSDLIASVLGGDDELWSDFVEAHDGSLDAAKRLHDALLPGWVFDITNGSAFVMPPWDEPFSEPPTQYIGEDDVDARAWLLAILRAMEGRDG